MDESLTDMMDVDPAEVETSEMDAPTTQELLNDNVDSERGMANSQNCNFPDFSDSGSQEDDINKLRAENISKIIETESVRALEQSFGSTQAKEAEKDTKNDERNVSKNLDDGNVDPKANHVGDSSRKESESSRSAGKEKDVRREKEGGDNVTANNNECDSAEEEKDGNDDTGKENDNRNKKKADKSDDGDRENDSDFITDGGNSSNQEICDASEKRNSSFDGDKSDAMDTNEIGDDCSAQEGIENVSTEVGDQEKTECEKVKEKEGDVNESKRDSENDCEEDKEEEKSKKAVDEDEIMEIPVEKKMAEVVDLADEEADTTKDSESEDSGAENSAKGLKLRSLASLVDTSNGQTSSPNKDMSVINTPGAVLANPEAFGAVGEIVEHKDMFGDSSGEGLPLQISNVVGGEDCITGLAMDDDRDMLSAIQISSVTTLIDPISPEDPNKDMDQEGLTGDRPENDEDTGIKIVSAESLASKDEDADKSQDVDAAGPKIRLSSAVSEVAKDSGVEDSTASTVYHVLRSILTMPRDCLSCMKKTVCEFRITKKGEPGTFAFLCSVSCRGKWTTGLPSSECVEKPRLIFEKLCGMCNKDLTSQPRSGQFSWETREFCSEDCLTSHLEEVASKCHMCFEAVRPLYIGKYCVRFGSDIHQFCSNSCLERYKSKIKVCCYCQKNVENVTKVTSPANKEYCCVKCLKRAQRRDIGQQNYSEEHPCTVCQTKGLNRYEFLMNGDAQQLCSDPCLNVFKYVNKVKAVTCCLCFRVMNAEDVSQYLYHGGHQLRVFCSDSCVNVFILSARRIVNCDFCKVKKYNFDMIHRQVDEEFKEYYYCSLQCTKNRHTASGKNSSSTGNTSSTATTDSNSVTTSANVEAPMAVCSMCNTTAKAQFHMVMSDNTLRSFCQYDCAARYKSTFGYLVENQQSKETSQSKTPPPPTIRPKPTSQLTAKSTESDSQPLTKSAGTSVSPETLQATAEILKMLIPPSMENKTTMCKPATCTKGVYCRPHPWHRETQTDLAGIDSTLSDKELPPILPVPIPCYVPAPMCMYNAPFPVPIFVPIPLPVPIFLPTTAKTSKDIMAMMKKIEEEIPTDPIQAEMLLLARQSIEEHKDKAQSKANAEEPVEGASSPADNFTSYSGDDEAVNDEANNDEVNSADEACLNTMEDDLPRYTLRDADMSSNYGDAENQNDNRRKRKKKGRGRPKKRVKRDSDEESPSMSDQEEMDDPDFLPEPETVLDEFQGPFLNKMYGLTAWKSWVTKKNAELAGVSSMRSMKLISEDLLTMNCDELNYALCLFLKDLRKPNGEMYQPDSIYYLLLGIQQHLFESSRTDCIFMDFGFEKFTNSLDEITRTFWVSPTLPGVSPMVSLGVTRITEAMLWECRQLGAHTPQVLLNTLFYFNTKVFKLKTVDDHLSMSFVQIVKQWRSTMGRDGSGTRTTLLKYYRKKSSTDSDKPRQNYEMHENRDDPLRCPVKLYEFYLSKCPESVRHQRHVYYVYPERSCVPDSPVWFSTQAVHATSISKMLNRALMVREVQESFAE